MLSLRSRDVVVSFPKAGRTWLHVMLDDLGLPVEFSHCGSHHGKRVPISAISTRAERKYDRILFLHRDPRDTAVSGYHQMRARKKNGYDGTLSDFVRDPCHGVEKIIDFNRMWFDLARRRDKMMVISYEDLKADTGGALGRIVAFFGHRIDPARIAEVAAAHTFERMHQKEAAGEFAEKWGAILAARDPGDPDSFKVRRGKVGGYRDELSAEDVAWCDAVLAAKGYDASAP